MAFGRHGLEHSNAHDLERSNPQLADSVDLTVYDPVAPIVERGGGERGTSSLTFGKPRAGSLSLHSDCDSDDRIGAAATASAPPPFVIEVRDPAAPIVERPQRRSPSPGFAVPSSSHSLSGSIILAE